MLVVMAPAMSMVAAQRVAATGETRHPKREGTRIYLDHRSRRRRFRGNPGERPLSHTAPPAKNVGPRRLHRAIPMPVWTTGDGTADPAATPTSARQQHRDPAARGFSGLSEGFIAQGEGHRRKSEGWCVGRSRRDTLGRGGVQLLDVGVVGAQRCADFDAGAASALSLSRSWTTTISTARDGDTDRTRWGVFASK